MLSKDIINNDLFQYNQWFYNLCPNISLSLEVNKSSSLYNKTAVFFNKNGNKYDHF